MKISEQTLRQVALACWENAASLSTEAKLLTENGYEPRAVALTILGLEEFAKAIAYTVATLSNEPQANLLEKLRHLTHHEVKHLLANSAEYVQIITEDWNDGIEWQTGFRPSPEQLLAAMFQQLARSGIGGLIDHHASAKAFLEAAKPTAIFEDDEMPFGPDLKNAALYVDLTPDGRIKLPDAVRTRAESEILSLDWFLGEYQMLPRVLGDDSAWNHFRAAACGKAA